MNAGQSCRVERVQSLATLERIRTAWNLLADRQPFQSWEWLGAWWRAYGGRRELYVLLVRDERGQLLGAAPWFRESTARQGRVIRFLGSGAACTDYATLICRPQHRDRVACAIAEWLDKAAAVGGPDRWDLLIFENTLADDGALLRLIERLRNYGGTLIERPAMNCWAVALPASWDEYLKKLSKGHRKSLRKLERRFLEQSGRFALHQSADHAQLGRGIEVLVDLHQRRWRALGEPGCFACDRFAQFLKEATRALFEAGQVQLTWLEDEGVPVAAQLSFSDAQRVYVYQGGIDPNIDEYPPGHLLHIKTMQQAIDAGANAFDFLRGDEPYKAHWRAEPVRCCDWRIASPRPAAQVRNNAWLAGDAVKRAIKRSLRRTGWLES